MNQLINLADTRNTITHSYDQVLAQEVYNNIVKHYHAFGAIVFIKSIKKTTENKIYGYGAA